MYVCMYVCMLVCMCVYIYAYVCISMFIVLPFPSEVVAVCVLTACQDVVGNLWRFGSHVACATDY